MNRLKFTESIELIENSIDIEFCLFMFLFFHKIWLGTIPEWNIVSKPCQKNHVMISSRILEEEKNLLSLLPLRKNTLEVG